MKAAINGVLNMSTLDGWWCEGYIPESGWIIGAGEEYEDLSYQDQVESQAIFNLLEQEVVPLFYSRTKDRLPREWIRRMKNTIKWCAPRFNTSRMTAEYTRRYYRPAAVKWGELTENGETRVRALAEWKMRTRLAWEDLSILNVSVQSGKGGQYVSWNGSHPELEVGSNLSITAEVRLGRLNPSDVSVQIYYGHVNSAGVIEDGQVAEMEYEEGSLNPDRIARFRGTIVCHSSGKQGFCLRILPRHQDLIEPYEPGMVLWESARA